MPSTTSGSVYGANKTTLDLCWLYRVSLVHCRSPGVLALPCILGALSLTRSAGFTVYPWCTVAHQECWLYRESLVHCRSPGVLFLYRVSLVHCRSPGVLSLTRSAGFTVYPWCTVAHQECCLYRVSLVHCRSPGVLASLCILGALSLTRSAGFTVYPWCTVAHQECCFFTVYPWCTVAHQECCFCLIDMSKCAVIGGKWFPQMCQFLAY